MKVPRKFLTAKDTLTYPVGAAIVRIDGKEMLNLVTISKEGMRAIGMLSLESFRFKVDPIKGKLEYLGPPLV
jgi:predicted aspartyl protease